MYKLLIVEDETLYSDFLKDSIDWQTIDVEVLGVCANGETALDYIRVHKPDVVLADINMPKMDGLELIRQLKEEKTEAGFVVISGYDDFHLVKEAFKLGVVDYVLKSELDPENLKAIVKRTIESRQPKTEDYRNDQILLFKEQYLKELIWGAKTFDDKSRDLNLRIHNQNLTVLVLQILNYDAVLKQKWERESELLKYGLMNMLDELLEQHMCGEVVIKADSELVFLLSFHDASAVHRETEAVARHIMQTLAQYFDFVIGAGYSGFTDRASNLKVLYEEAKLAAAYTFVTGREQIVFYPDEQAKDDEAEFEERSLSTFEAKIWDFDFETLLRNFDSFIYTTAPISHVERLQQIYKRYFDIIAAFAKKHMNTVNVTETYRSILSTGTLAELNEYLRQTLCTLQEALGDEYKIIFKIQKYVKKNFSKNITLESIASEFGIDYKKLSRRFLKQTGISLKKYIIEVRMQEAMHLITQTDYFLHEIANMVGYSNYESFSRSFYNYFGKWPKAVSRN